MKMSDNRASQLIQQLRDALELGDDDLATQIRSDLFKEFGIEMADGGRVDLQAGGMPKPKPTMGIMASNAARALPGVASRVGGKALSLGLGTPALMYEVMAGQTGGAFGPIYGKYDDERFTLNDVGVEFDEPIPELGGYSYEELVTDPDYIEYAKEFGMSPDRYVTELIADTILIPKKGPADPSAFTMEELEEYYGDTPFFRDYRENVPLGDRASRGFDKVQSGILSALNPFGAFDNMKVFNN
jgi:hypothetical protein